MLKICWVRSLQQWEDVADVGVSAAPNPAQHRDFCPFTLTISTILVVLSPVPGLAPAHFLHWMFAQALGNQGLGVDAVEEGDAAAPCAQCNQFHIQGQELLSFR